MDEVPPITGLQADSELATQIQNEIRKKLQAEYSHAGNVETMSQTLPVCPPPPPPPLPFHPFPPPQEYIKVMVCNAKPRSQVVEDLQLFLKGSAPNFVEWLWGMLADRNPERTHSAFGNAGNAGGGGGGGGAVDDDEGMGEDRPGQEGGVQLGDDRARGRGLRARKTDAEYPSARGFRNALQTAARESREGKPERERRGFRMRDDAPAASGNGGGRSRSRERDYERGSGGKKRREFQKGGLEVVSGGDGGDGRRERRHRRHSSEERAKGARKQFNRMGEQELTTMVEPQQQMPGMTRFRITDSKDASDIAARFEVIEAEQRARERAAQREALMHRPTKFTITLDKLGMSAGSLVPRKAHATKHTQHRPLRDSQHLALPGHSARSDGPPPDHDDRPS